MRLHEISSTQTIDLTPTRSPDFADSSKILHNPFWDLPSPLRPYAAYYSPNQLLPRSILDLLGRQGSRPAGGLWHVAIIADDDSGAAIAEELYTRELGMVTCAATRIDRHLLGSHIETILAELGSRVWGEPVVHVSNV
ncbi:MAG: hypothetical protein JKY31_00735 [Rhodobacteraceae bacterium]|nr:hypothetical protein [Paracoccaceae bacterium]